MDKIRFAIIGAGHIGKRHAEMIRRNPEAELVAICDIRPEKDLGIENLGVPYFSDATAMLETEMNVDVVSVCSPNGLHAPHALMALDKGKHIVCEKPMALT